MSEPRHEVHCQGCGKFLWSQAVPRLAGSTVTSGCCLEKCADGGSVPIMATTVDGEEIAIATVHQGSTMNGEGLPFVKPHEAWHRRSCPWRSCDSVTLWKGTTAPPLLCGTCGRTLDRVCLQCGCWFSRVPDDQICCGQPLGSTAPTEHLAARVAA